MLLHRALAVLVLPATLLLPTGVGAAAPTTTAATLPASSSCLIASGGCGHCGPLQNSTELPVASSSGDGLVVRQR